MALVKPLLAPDFRFQESKELNSAAGIVTEENIRNARPKCFRTDERYFCQKSCLFKQECKKLRAVWLR